MCKFSQIVSAMAGTAINLQLLHSALSGILEQHLKFGSSLEVLAHALRGT
jgi:hypothetical protein